MQQASVFIVDDHPLVRRGLSQLISGEPEFTVFGEASNIDEALNILRYSEPDLVIIDLSLPDGNGLDLVKRLLARNPELPILVSSMHDEMLFAERALKAGAKGYINKSAAGDEMIDAIKRVSEGKRYLSQQVSEQLSRKIAGKNKNIGQSPAETLSNRELEVFESIGRGMGTSDIASSLKLSIKTIESHRANIKKKLGLTCSGQLIRSAIQWSLEAK